MSTLYDCDDPRDPRDPFIADRCVICGQPLISHIDTNCHELDSDETTGEQGLLSRR